MYGIILTGSSFICGIILLCLVYTKRPPGILWPSLFFVYLGATIWSAGEFMTAFVVDDSADYWIWIVILYLGVYLLLGSWLTFGLRFAALLEVDLPKKFSLLVPAVMVFYGLMSLVTITNPWHGQFMVAHKDAPNDFLLMWYLQASVGYLILLLVGGICVYLRLKKHHATVSRQATILLLATSIPMVANFLYISQIVKPGFDITIPAFSISSILFFLGIYRDRLFILSPIPLQQVIQNEQDGIFILDNYGRILLFNHAAHELLHEHDIFTNDQLAPILSQYLYHPDTSGHLSKEELSDLINEKKHPVNGYLLRMDHSETQWIRLVCTVLPSPHNRPAGMGVRLRDVTVLQQATEAMTNQSMVLEGINEQLKKALRETEKLALDADRANAAKTDFLANMSHEIRTSMNGIIGMTQLLLDSPMNVEQRLFADTAHNGAKTLLSIINDILDYSKISAGKMNIETVDLDLHQLLEETIDLLTVAAEEAGLYLYCCIDAAVPQIISSDPTRLRQIILNLVNNAIKFTPQGEVGVYCTMDKQVSDPPSIHIEVQDTGIGITQDQHEQLFEPFTQADSSTTRNFGGSGLGLSICKTLVTLMNGSIGVESRENQGSTFWISLPVNTQYDPPVSHTIFQGQTCLIASSKPHFINILTRYLTSWGAECRTASTSQDAEKQLTIHPLPTVILVDFTLEDMSGIEFGKQLQAHPDFGSIPRLLYFPLYKSELSSSLVDEYFTQGLTLPIKILPLQEALSKCIGVPEEALTPLSSPSPTSDKSVRPGPLAMRVLLVEDNSVNQLIAGRLLKNLNVDYDQVVNGQDALQAINKNRYDIVFMDCQMPVMDGYETAQAIRNLTDPDRKSLPIIAMTASAIKGDRERCFEAGMDGYLTKPIHLEQLKGMVEKYSTSPSQTASDVSDRPAPPPG